MAHTSKLSLNLSHQHSQPLVESTAEDYLALLKPRVMSLVVFTGWVGMFVAPGVLHPFIAFIAILCIAIGAGAAGAINMWYDADIDRLMPRTQQRPVPAGRIAAEDALSFGVILAAGSVLVMGLSVNWLAASLLAFSIFFYVFIYTMWLKRRTPQNIVIGGAAGALPPMIGWAAVSGEVSWFSFIMFLIIFMWTPPHFWALSLYQAKAYADAGVPMLPVVKGAKSTKAHILAYSILLTPITLIPYFYHMAGKIYGLGASLLGVAFLIGALRVYRNKDDKNISFAKQLFGYSILYLFILFLLIVVDKVL